jgi:hypothetical protein
MSTFTKTLEALLNRHSVDNETSTPDFILAEYLTDCLEAYEKLIKARYTWTHDALIAGTDLTMHVRRPLSDDLLNAENQAELQKVRQEANELKSEISELKQETQWIQWVPATSRPAFDGDYYCLAEVKRDDGSTYVQHLITKFIRGKWLLIPGLKLLYWTKTLQEP